MTRTRRSRWLRPSVLLTILAVVLLLCDITHINALKMAAQRHRRIGGNAASSSSLVRSARLKQHHEAQMQSMMEVAASTAEPAPAPAPITVQTTAVMKDPITNALESKYAWVFLVLIGLLFLGLILWCFRDSIGTCVSFLETCLYKLFTLILMPIKLLVLCVKAVFYPVKQAGLAVKDRVDRYCYPSHMRVAGLRY